MTIMETEVVFMELTEQRRPWKVWKRNPVLSFDSEFHFLCRHYSQPTQHPFSEILWLASICILGAFVA